MSDARLRELERRWRESGSTEDEAAYLRERVRVGDLTQERLELAAFLGHPAAGLATQRQDGLAQTASALSLVWTPARYRLHPRGELWAKQFAAWGRCVVARGLLGSLYENLAKWRVLHTKLALKATTLDEFDGKIRPLLEATQTWLSNSERMPPEPPLAYPGGYLTEVHLVEAAKAIIHGIRSRTVAELSHALADAIANLVGALAEGLEDLPDPDLIEEAEALDSGWWASRIDDCLIIVVGQIRACLTPWALSGGEPEINGSQDA